MAAIPHVIIDDFLPEEIHRGLLEHALGVADFAPGSVRIGGEYQYAPDERRGLLSDDRLGAFQSPFRAAIDDRADALCAELGIPPFVRSGFETRLVAHGDGDFFKPHRDVFTGKDRALMAGDRVITLVYYFHRQPRGFSGGELQLFPFGDQPPVVVEPRDNRLVAFPSLLLHEVLPVVVPDRDFANSRFSVSCWLSRARPGAPVLP